MESSDDEGDFKRLSPEHLLLKMIASTDSEKYKKFFNSSSFKNISEMNSSISNSIKNEELSIITEQIHNLIIPDYDILSHGLIKDKNNKKRKNRKSKKKDMDKIIEIELNENIKNKTESISVIEEITSQIDSVVLQEINEIKENLSSQMDDIIDETKINFVKKQIIESIDSVIPEEINEIIPQEIKENLSSQLDDIIDETKINFVKKQIIESIDSIIPEEINIIISEELNTTIQQNIEIFNQILNNVENMERLAEKIENKVEEVKTKKNCLLSFLSIFLSSKKPKDSESSKSNNVSI